MSTDMDVDPSTYNMPITVRPDGVDVSYPCFWRDDFFFRSGILRPYKLCKLLDSARALTLKLNPMLRSIDYSTNTLFLLSVGVTVTPQLHLMTVGKRSFPFTIVSIVAGVKRTSFVTEQYLYITGDMSKELLTCRTVFVQVSLDLLRPSLLPIQLKGTAEGTNKIEERVQIPEAPASAFRYELEVQPRHIDFNQHTNQASYILFCSDAAAVASGRAAYRGIRNFTEIPVLETFSRYLGESTEGDVVVIATWQDDEQIIHFVMTLKGKGIFYGRWKLGDFISNPKL